MTTGSGLEIGMRSVLFWNSQEQSLRDLVLCLKYKKTLLLVTYTFFCWQLHFSSEARVATKIRKKAGSSCYGVACVFDWFTRQFKRISPFSWKLLPFFDSRLKSCLWVALFFGKSKLGTSKKKLPTKKNV